MSVFCGCSYDTYEIGTELSVEYVTAYMEDWKIDNTDVGYSLYQSFPIKDITQDVINNGAVLVYFVDKKNDRDNMLPYVFPIYVPETGQMLLENIRFDVEKGWISIVIEWEDGLSSEILEDYTFKVCVMSPGQKKKER